MDELEKLFDQLIHIEGSSLTPYRDGSGNFIVAEAQAEHDSRSQPDRLTLLESDVLLVASELTERWPAVSRLDPVRRRVLIHMAFNLGVTGLLAMPRFVSAVEFRFWNAAAEEMLLSQWAKQHQPRATALATMMRTGRDEPVTVSQARSRV